MIDYSRSRFRLVRWWQEMPRGRNYPTWLLIAAGVGFASIAVGIGSIAVGVFRLLSGTVPP